MPRSDRRKGITIAVALIVSLNLLTTIRAAEVPTPQEVLGFRPGDDFHLATWSQVASYLRAVDEASDRVLVRELGKTTEGRPYLVAIVSAAGTIEDLDTYRELQHQLADPRYASAKTSLLDPVRDSKPVVLITGSIHSSETASTLMALELLHGLATGEDDRTREILDGAILMLVPSANPDGVDKVAAWYERSKGTPWEGSGMPELYHKYAGHDTNRDWFMLNLQETRLLTRLLYREWFPTITYDVHQMGSLGARLFVPPFHDPINPNLDPRINQSIFLIGAHMAADLAREGKKGIVTNAIYDNWWNGGNRTVPQRHNMIGVLTEAASVRLASPIFLDRSDLQGGSRGFSGHDPAVNFVDPWPGGWWHLRDILEYELICARSVLTLAARYRDQFQAGYRDLARDAIAEGKSHAPFVWVVPADQVDLGRASAMVEILHQTGIDVLQPEKPFQAAGRSFPAGSWVLPAAQPYRAYLKDTLERQQYPDRRTAGGEAETPYDVAGWTLPLQMGVETVEIDEPLLLDASPLDQIDAPGGEVVNASSADLFRIENKANDDFVVLNALLSAGIDVHVILEHITRDQDRTLQEFPTGSLVFPANDTSRAVLEDVIPSVSIRVEGLTGSIPSNPRLPVARIAPLRLGVYQPWVPSMDEGWVRLVLENHRFAFTTLHNAEIRAGGLKERFDTILIPSISEKTLREGYAPDETEPAYVGGLGEEGAEALRVFVREGGTLVCLESSCPYAIELLDLPIRNPLAGLDTKQFYGPGSLVGLDITDGSSSRADVNRESALLNLGMPRHASAYFDRSLAFELTQEQPRVGIAARYAGDDVLQSGWLLGPEQIEGKAAVVSALVENGRVILFAFPPEHRGQTQGTFRLFFNALFRGAIRPVS